MALKMCLNKPLSDVHHDYSEIISYNNVSFQLFAPSSGSTSIPNSSNRYLILMLQEQLKKQKKKQQQKKQKEKQNKKKQLLYVHFFNQTTLTTFVKNHIYHNCTSTI